MKTPELFNRHELSRTLWEFRYEFVVAGVFSMVANVLMLTPTLYMLQVYDRVIPTRSEYTLLILSLGVLLSIGFELAMKYARSRLMDFVVVGVDSHLSREIFHRLLQLLLKKCITTLFIYQEVVELILVEQVFYTQLVLPQPLQHWIYKIILLSII